MKPATKSTETAEEDISGKSVSMGNSDERIQREVEFHDRLAHQQHGKISCYDHGGNRRALTELLKLAGNLEGKEILEFGCGQGWLTVDLAQPGAHVSAFDISEESLKKAAAYAAKCKVADRISFQKENAEALSYPDSTFDLVVGGAILHHLDIEKASHEIHRVLKQGGKALFLEPLGHNPFINLYRKMTPHKRTPDEHPLQLRHIRALAAPFAKARYEYFYFFAIYANVILVLTRNASLFQKAYDALDKADTAFLNRFPFFRKYCWSVIIVLEK